jgi:hypothetical protein
MIRNQALAFIALAIALPAIAQQDAPPMTPEQQAQMEAYVKAGTPGEQHAALAKMAGNYDLKIRSWHTPGGEPTSDTGTATRKMILGNRVMVEEVTAQMMGEAFGGHGLHGYENATGKYWSTWNDSMSTGVMVSEGSCDAKMTCTYTGSWVDPMTKKTATSRMTTRWTDERTELFEMHGPGPDGKEMKMMEITYTRK